VIRLRFDSSPFATWPLGVVQKALRDFWSVVARNSGSEVGKPAVSRSCHDSFPLARFRKARPLSERRRNSQRNRAREVPCRHARRRNWMWVVFRLWYSGAEWT
jgi:hypothetical protein